MLHRRLALSGDWELRVLFREAFGLLLLLLVTRAEADKPGLYNSGNRNILGPVK